MGGQAFNGSVPGQINGGIPPQPHMNSEKTSPQFRDQAANSTEDAHGILAVTLIEVTQIDLFKSAVVTEFKRAQAGDGFHQS